jgi:hypothetical protein
MVGMGEVEESRQKVLAELKAILEVNPKPYALCPRPWILNPEPHTQCPDPLHPGP